MYSNMFQENISLRLQSASSSFESLAVFAAELCEAESSRSSKRIQLVPFGFVAKHSRIIRIKSLKLPGFIDCGLWHTNLGVDWQGD